MRNAIISLSANAETKAVTEKTVSFFLQQVRQPGLLQTSNVDVYKLAMDYVAMLKTQIEYFSRMNLLTLTKPKPIQLNPHFVWSWLSQSDESGALHRWRFVDYINDDTILTELHSWELFGDLALSRMPMTLHLVSIGRRDDSHHLSPWCRAYKAPSFNMYKFQKKSGGGLSDNWKPIYFADDIDMDAEAWVEQMIEDGVANNLVQHINVSEPAAIHTDMFRRDLDLELADRLERISVPWYNLPMSRGACDKPYVCPHQELCFSLDPRSELAGNPLYEKLK